MAWWKRAHESSASQESSPSDESSTLVIEIDLPEAVDHGDVAHLVAAWCGGPVPEPGSVTALAPGLLLGGPEEVGGSSRWFVAAARTEEGDPWADLDLDADDSVFALVGAMASLAQLWLDRRPASRDELLCGAAAFGLALADGVARRLGGSIRIDGSAPQPPAPREPTRVVHLSDWITAADASAVVGNLLPGLELAAGGAVGDDWVVAQPGGYGLILSARDADTRIPMESVTWQVEARPDTAPLVSRPDQPWMLSVEGPVDHSTPEIDVVLDAAARALADHVGSVAVDLEGFPVA